MAAATNWDEAVKPLIKKYKTKNIRWIMKLFTNW